MIWNDTYDNLVSTEIGYTGSDYGMLRARASTIGPWEQYNILCVPGFSHHMVIQSRANGLYVSTEIGYTGSDYGMLRARASTVGPWGQYIDTEYVC